METEIMGVAFATSPAALAGRVAGFVISQHDEGKHVEINEFANGIEITGVSKDPMRGMNGGELELRGSSRSRSV